VTAMLYCICQPKPTDGEPHSPACRFQNFEADRDPDSLADLNRQRFRQEYPTASQIIRGEPLPDEDEVITATPPPKSERDLLLDDLEDRLRRGIDELFNLRNPIHADNPDDRFAIRLGGKIDGLRLVQDWLQSYR
jgi:hypothetical protein